MGLLSSLQPSRRVRGSMESGGCYLLWTMLWVGVIWLIVLQSVPLPSLCCFDPGFFSGSARRWKHSSVGANTCAEVLCSQEISLKWFLRLRRPWRRTRLWASRDGAVVQMPAREFKRGHLLQRGLGRGKDVGEGRLSHSWDGAATRSAPRVNRCWRQMRSWEKQGGPGASRASSSLPALPDTEKTNAHPINIFPLGV